MKKMRFIKNIAIFILIAVMLIVGTIPSLAENTTDFNILSATYGQAANRIDVKSILLDKQDSQGKIEEFKVCKEEFGDINGQEVNHLIVQYTKNGEKKYLSIADGNVFSLPFKYDVEQLEETKHLINKPLTVSNVEKIWPTSTGIRGFNLGGLIGPFTSNDGNEGLYVTDKDFKRLKEMGVNCLRVGVSMDDGVDWSTKDIPKDNPMAPYTHHLEALKVALHLAEKYDMWIIPTAGNVVGRQIDVMYNEADGGGYNETLIQLWEYIAKNYGSHPRLLGYDLLNEPNTANDEAYYFDVVLPELVKKIREYDKNTYIIVETAPYAFPSKFSSLKPIDDKKAVYSLHFYWPHQYTHQGIGNYTDVQLSYPGTYGNFPNDIKTFWDKEALDTSVQAVVKFQQENNAIIWVGEFGVLRYAENAHKWVSDIISVFEQYGWDWCYHSYGSYNGFNPTFGPFDKISNIMDGGKDTDILKVLKSGFALNGVERGPLEHMISIEKNEEVSNDNHQEEIVPPDTFKPEKIENDENETTILSNSGIKIISQGLSKKLNFEAKRISKGKEYNSIKTLLPKGTKGFAVYRLSLFGEDGTAYKLEEKIEINIPLSKGMDDVVVSRLNEKNKLEPLYAYINDGIIAFESDVLGDFVILKAKIVDEVKYEISTRQIVIIIIAGIFALIEIGYLIISLVVKKRKSRNN